MFCDTEQKASLIEIKKDPRRGIELSMVGYGSPKREAARTLEGLFKKLFEYFSKLNISKDDNNFVNYITSKTEKKSRNNFLKLNN
jgi:Holliday junction resolvase RusA-like endonuclease